MNIRDVKSVEALLAAVDKCENDVFITDRSGSRISLKSRLSRYVALGILIKDETGEFELFAQSKNDEAILLNMLNEHKEMI